MHGGLTFWGNIHNLKPNKLQNGCGQCSTPPELMAAKPTHLADKGCTLP